MQETQHKITGEMRQEFFEALSRAELDRKMDKRLKELPDERLVRREKIGRNELCPCNSGLKFKKCCIRFVNRY